MTTFFQEVVLGGKKTSLSQSLAMKSFFIPSNTGTTCIFCSYVIECQFITNIHERRKCSDCGIEFRSLCELLTDMNISVELPNYNTRQVFCSHKKLYYSNSKQKHTTTDINTTKKYIGRLLGIQYVDGNFFRGCKKSSLSCILLYEMAEFVNNEEDGAMVENMFKIMKLKKITANGLLDLFDESKNSIPELVVTFITRKRSSNNSSSPSSSRSRSMSSSKCKREKKMK